MPSELFSLVPQIRQDPKYFNVSVDEIIWQVRKSAKFETEYEHNTIETVTGRCVSVRLHLKIAGEVSHRLSWDMALFLECSAVRVGARRQWKRIDGSWVASLVPWD